MQPKVVFPSVRNTFFSQVNCNFFFRRANIFTQNVAFTTSILKAIIYFKDATQDFSVAKRQLILPFPSHKLNSTITPKAVSLKLLSADNRPDSEAA